MTEDGGTEVGGADVDRLTALEESLWRSASRFDRAWMERVLHPGFHEFGRSGRRWTRDEILDMPAVDVDVVWPPGDLAVGLVAPGVALLTYVVTDADGNASNRSSLWLQEPAVEDSDPTSGWRLRFHQGGPTAG